MACSEGKAEGSVSKACRKGLSEKWLRAGFRDRWHSPKGGPAGVSAKSSKGGIRQSFGKASKMGGVFRGHAARSEGVSSKGLPRGSFEGWSSEGSTAGGSGRWILDLRLRLVG